jgi:hypothetical protein
VLLFTTQYANFSSRRLYICAGFVTISGTHILSVRTCPTQDADVIDTKHSCVMGGGALSMGEAILHLDRGIFLGQPLIDTARLEHTQLCIGASFAGPFMSQIVPKRYQLPFTGHFKQHIPQSFSGITVDWPRHWRKTREANLIDMVRALDVDSRFSQYYKRTEEIVIASESIAHLYESPGDSYITKVYPQFSSPLLKLRLRPFRVEASEQRTDEQ